MFKSTETFSRIAWLIFCLVILGVTLFPFHFQFTRHYFEMRARYINWFPIDFSRGHLGERLIWEDYAVNIVMFIPFGYFGCKSLSGISLRAKILSVLLLGFLFSMGIEFTQLFTETRDTTLTDVIWNVVSTGIGILLAARTSFG